MESFQSILKASLILYSNQEIHNAIKNIAEDINNDISYVGEGCITDEIRDDLLKLGWLVAPGGDNEQF